MDKKPLAPGLGLVISKNRDVLQKYGEFYGKRIFLVVKENVDLLFNQKKAEGQPSLIKPLFKFIPKPIDIYNIKLIDADGSGEPCVIINDDVDLKFPVKNPDFKDVTPVSVKEALNSEVPVFFADIEKLTKELNSLNMAEYRKASTLATEFTKQASFLSSLCSQNEVDMKEYKRQLCESDPRQEEITINQTVTVES